MGKMVHDTWNEMNGGISVRIKNFKLQSAYIEMFSSYAAVEQHTTEFVNCICIDLTNLHDLLRLNT